MTRTSPPCRPGNDLEGKSLLDVVEKGFLYVGVGLGSITVVGLLAGIIIISAVAS